VPLAIFLGHYYDQRIFLDTGYLVSAGLNPYQQHLVTVFSNSYLNGLNPIIGYPPPWPLLLGLIYQLTYSPTGNLFLYNFATKIPIIAANIALAYATKAVMEKQHMPQKTVRFTWVFMLFNPFTLLTTVAWGQFDTLVALLCVVGVYLLSQAKTAQSALLISLSFMLKPISFPLLALPLLCASKGVLKKAVAAAVMLAVVLVLWFLPFYLLNWAAPVSSGELSSFFRMAGGMTLFNLVDVFARTSNMPAGLWFLGYLWIPLLAAGFFWVYRRKPRSMVELAECAAVLLLIFFLSRSWLSEQNLNLLFPFLLILVGAGILSLRRFHWMWVVPLAFLVLNASLPQLFFLVYPPVIPLREAFDVDYGTVRLAARFAITIVWYIVALAVLFKIGSKQPEGDKREKALMDHTLVS
jgi:hypothetical protein